MDDHRHGVLRHKLSAKEVEVRAALWVYTAWKMTLFYYLHTFSIIKCLWFKDCEQKQGSVQHCVSD